MEYYCVTKDDDKNNLNEYSIKDMQTSTWPKLSEPIIINMYYQYF